MKKFLTLLMLMVFGICNSQVNMEYPIFTNDSLGNRVVIMTEKQASILVNDSKLLALFKDKYNKLDEYSKFCLVVVNEKDQVIMKQDVIIQEMEKKIKLENVIIDDLNKERKLLLDKISLTEQQYSNSEEKVKELNKQLRKVKVKNAFFGTIGGLAITGLIILLISQ